ncbi:MAG: hypothetical protein PHO27_09745 [Sulfuricurvum sp.]|nr:hypothetical protein [Sulfuricurvum sp.]
MFFSWCIPSNKILCLSETDANGQRNGSLWWQGVFATIIGVSAR